MTSFDEDWLTGVRLSCERTLFMATVASVMKSEVCVSYSKEGYWYEATRPLVSLYFVLPWLLAYELGVLCMGESAARNGADLWLRQWLRHIGLGTYALLPLLVIVALLSWHYVRRDPWWVSGRVVVGMLVESLLWAVLLIAAAQMAYPWWSSWERGPHCTVLSPAYAAQVITYCGAGLYEETLFRLALLPLLMAMGLSAGLPVRVSRCLAILCSSLLFAAVHYQWDVPMENLRVCVLYGDAFHWGTFMFRFAAGAVFAILFFTRGFGIVVGTHALYDILAACL